MVRWGAWSGVASGVALALASPVLGPLFTSDADVRHRLMTVLLIAALGQPLAGVVFVLDGVLIGAGDGRYLAWGGVVVLAAYAPVALATVWLGGGLLAVWLAFSLVFLGARFVILTTRARGERWLVTGAANVA
jgi:Na+-driven multidrug efflux pump